MPGINPELLAELLSQVSGQPQQVRPAVPGLAGLTGGSPEFTQLWGRHDVEEATRGRMRVIHPLVGELSLD